MPADSQRHGKIAFALLVAATLAVLGWVACAFGGDQVFLGMLAQTQNVDAQGYLSEYDARMVRLSAPTPAPTVKIDGPSATPGEIGAPEDVVVVAPAKPQAPRRAEQS